MLHNGTQILFDYWTELKGSRNAPNRAEISPAAIAQILPSTFILQDERDRGFEFRLAGTALCLLYNTELKGCTFSSLLDSDDRNLCNRLLVTAHKERVAIQLQLEAISETGRSVTMEGLILPLGDDQPRLLGSLHILDMPYWVGADQIISTTIMGVRLLDPTRDLIALHNRPAIMMHDRAWLRKNAKPTARFSVLHGGAMLAGSQITRLRPPHTPQLTVYQGGRE